MNENLIENFGELAHSHEAGYGMCLCWDVIDAGCNAMRRPKFRFGTVIHYDTKLESKVQKRAEGELTHHLWRTDGGML